MFRQNIKEFDVGTAGIGLSISQCSDKTDLKEFDKIKAKDFLSHNVQTKLPFIKDKWGYEIHFLSHNVQTKHTLSIDHKHIY